MLNQIKLNIGRHICLSVYLCLYKKAYLCASDFLWEKAKTYTLKFSIVVRWRRLCENTSKTVSSANKWKEWKVVQPKKREITKKNVSVPILFLYFKSYSCKMLIYSILLYIKITFTRFPKVRIIKWSPNHKTHLFTIEEICNKDTQKIGIDIIR